MEAILSVPGRIDRVRAAPVPCDHGGMDIVRGKRLERSDQ
jgi:hypothetical protein